MRICKFQGPTMREAIALVRRELGPDAMVVATRQIRRGILGNGIEVTAATDVEETAQDGASAPSLAPGPRRHGGITDGDIERIMAPLRSELRSIRSMLRPIATHVPDDELRGELAALRQAIASLGRPAEPDRAAAPPVSLAELAAQGVLAAPSDKRVVALVGPTGAGKTTTIAKLAARAALVEQRSVAVLTLDTYRIGGEEQIRAYADLMGVPLHLVPDPMRLGGTVGSLARFDRVFVDTAGRSPRDLEAIGQLERAFAGVADLELHLVVAANAEPPLVDAWMSRYRSVGIDRLLFTKVDEAHDLAELVRAPVRCERPVSFITTGQRVPEDIEAANGGRLLDLAMRGFTAEAVAA